MIGPRSQPPTFHRDPAAEEVLAVSNLRTHFFTRDGEVPAVDGVSFVLRRGEILGLVGESGSGKSVTARSIVRLVAPPGRTVGGEIWFKGRNLLDLGRTEMRKLRGAEIAMILQEPMTSLNPVLTIGDQMTEVYRHHPERAPREGSFRDAAAKMLRAVRIPEPVRRLTEYPMHFSGGMRQRISIAMAAACEPDVIIADEPTTALDVTIQAQIIELMRELRDRMGTSFLLITHDLGIVAQFCDTVAVMYAGRIVEYQSVERLFDSPQHPYTRALLDSLPPLDRRRDRLPSIAGQPPDLLHLQPGCPFAPRCEFRTPVCEAEDPSLDPIADPKGAGGYVRCWLNGEPERLQVGPLEGGQSSPKR